MTRSHWRPKDSAFPAALAGVLSWVVPGPTGFGLARLIAALDLFLRLTRRHDAACGRPYFVPAGSPVLAGQWELGGIEGLDAVNERIFFVCHSVGGWQPADHGTRLTARILSVVATFRHYRQGNSLLQHKSASRMGVSLAGTVQVR